MELSYTCVSMLFPAVNRVHLRSRGTSVTDRVTSGYEGGITQSDALVYPSASSTTGCARGCDCWHVFMGGIGVQKRTHVSLLMMRGRVTKPHGAASTFMTQSAPGLLRTCLPAQVRASHMLAASAGLMKCSKLSSTHAVEPIRDYASIMHAACTCTHRCTTQMQPGCSSPQCLLSTMPYLCAEPPSPPSAGRLAQNTPVAASCSAPACACQAVLSCWLLPEHDSRQTPSTPVTIHQHSQSPDHVPHKIQHMPSCTQTHLFVPPRL